ncbi:MAG TPA: TonB-dependent receptor plug domain-containing protein, partial [Gemmatimonadales bacterium]|nr:TonB-dependent receptor plug domain-containing protein [Gemmatimonadales bacterium]
MEFAHQAGVQVVVDEAKLRGFAAREVRGVYTPREALRRLVGDVRLHVEWIGERTVAVRGIADRETLTTKRQAGVPVAPAVGETAPALVEVVVTAQKREQNLQDVPVAVTAVTAATLAANRVTDITGLTSLAPNMTILGGLPTIGMRGLVSQGTVAGQDKSVPIYLDGVSMGSTLGSVFDLPDLERIEVLRGPQGTLFGRNSTGGAISVITRNPSGHFSFHQALTYGTYDQFRSSTRIETPTWGAFSASLSYTHEEWTGEIKNLGAGTVWDRTAGGKGIAVSPKTLGDKNANSWFLAVKFEPNDRFNTVYKFDWLRNRTTSPGTALVAFTPEASLPASFAPLIRALYNANPIPIAGAHRPKYVNNAWTTPGYQHVWGHNLTSNWRIDDHLTAKNILSYRHSAGWVTGQITGAGGLRNIFPFLGPVGSPYALLEANVANSAEQWSDEVQLNYDSKLVTLTAGGIYFNLHTHEGAPLGIA